MKWLKIVALLVLTLAAMRAVSWAAGWLLSRFTSMKSRASAILSNAAAFLAFVLLLYANLLPGEPLDWAAVLFGLIVFALYAAADFYWRPWKPRL